MSRAAGGRRWLKAVLFGLAPLMAVAGPSAADYYVRDLPGVPTDSTPVKMHAGHIEVTPEHNGNLFFWHFQNKHIANRQRTVIWVNGGPGCSSEDGALMEIGPYRLTDDSTLRENEGSWHEFANLLFVDNPVGTGFSYVDTDSYIHELGEMADQFITFLGKFFEIFPEYNKDDIYIAGESYAGQHIPYIAQAILKRNQEHPDDPWNLSGLLIGNGWISPVEQYDAYLKYVFEKGLMDKDSAEGQQLGGMTRACHNVLASNPGHVTYRECESLLTQFLRLSKDPKGGDQACYNMYDVRLKDSYPSCGMNWPPDLVHVTPYLRKKEVVAALHVNPERNVGWEECNSAVSSSFDTKGAKPAIEILPELLSQIPILLFSGAEDLICNYMGTEDMISNMEWNSGKGFEVTPGTWAPRRDWTFEGENAGFWQAARNLTYVHFYNASHMVPFDFPRRSRDMLDRFMGVDITSIGGQPTDSRIDGEKGPGTSVGDVANPKESEEAIRQQLKEAQWKAYRRSGEVVLAFAIIAAAGFGFFIWRQRRKGAAYSALRSDDTAAASRDNFRDRQPADLESGQELQEQGIALQSTPLPSDKYSVGDDSDDEEGESQNGKPEKGNKNAQA